MSRAAIPGALAVGCGRNDATDHARAGCRGTLRGRPGASLQAQPDLTHLFIGPGRGRSLPAAASEPSGLSGRRPRGAPSVARDRGPIRGAARISPGHRPPPWRTQLERLPLRDHRRDPGAPHPQLIRTRQGATRHVQRFPDPQFRTRAFHASRATLGSFERSGIRALCGMAGLAKRRATILAGNLPLLAAWRGPPEGERPGSGGWCGRGESNPHGPRPTGF
jgi:hypothetical protein